jgi:AGCS family alanine or glycine:cation symporter
MDCLKVLISAIDIPLAFTFLGAGILLSLLTNFPQFKNLKEFIKILNLKKSHESTHGTISPLHALYIAMSTTLGMGNIVSPSIAIALGGPGALFWMTIYAIFGSVTKYVEVFFAVKYKRYAKDGSIIGGPTGYLYHIHPMLANWYGVVSIFLFSAWSALQSKTIATIYAHYNIEEYVTGLFLALFVFGMLKSGTKTIGKFASRIVPFLFIFYATTTLTILFSNIDLLREAILSIFRHAFAPTAPIGGFVGASMLFGLRQGIFKGAFTTEAGIGTAAIAHAYASTDNPRQQAILGMYSIFINNFLCIISGLITLITGVWKIGIVSNDLAFKAFTIAMPKFGPIILTATISLCILGATLGNSFNGSKTFGFFTNNKFMTTYYILVAMLIFTGSVIDTQTLWQITDLLLPLIVIPNLIGITILAVKNRKELMS